MPQHPLTSSSLSTTTAARPIAVPAILPHTPPRTHPADVTLLPACVASAIDSLGPSAGDPAGTEVREQAGFKPAGGWWVGTGVCVCVGKGGGAGGSCCMAARGGYAGGPEPPRCACVLLRLCRGGGGGGTRPVRTQRHPARDGFTDWSGVGEW